MRTPIFNIVFLRDFQRFEFRNKTFCVTTLISGKERPSATGKNCRKVNYLEKIYPSRTQKVKLQRVECRSPKERPSAVGK